MEHSIINHQLGIQSQSDVQMTITGYHLLRSIGKKMQPHTAFHVGLFEQLCRWITNAHAAGIVEYGAVSALTDVTTDDVDAVTVGARIQTQFLAFIDVLAHVGVGVQLSPHRTDTLEKCSKRNNLINWMVLNPIPHLTDTGKTFETSFLLLQHENYKLFLTWKLPGVLRHCPPSQRRLSTAHSLMSVHFLPVGSTW